MSLLPDVPIESFRPNQSPQNYYAVDLLPQLDVSQTDYHDVSVVNWYSYSPNAITCYGHHGQTTVFTQSPSIDISPSPLPSTRSRHISRLPIDRVARPAIGDLSWWWNYFHSHPVNPNKLKGLRHQWRFFFFIIKNRYLSLILPWLEWTRRLEVEKSERDVTSSPRCASCVGITGRKRKEWRPREYIHTRMNVHEKRRGKGETQWKKMHFTLYIQRQTLHSKIQTNEK